MRTLFTSDLHFGHTNIIGYCNRPFTDADEMNTAIVAMWNDTVSDSDEVWVLGDVCLGSIADTLPLVSELRGTKHLVVGNHDRPFGQPGGVWERRYLDAGFVSIHHGWVRHEVAGVPVALSHFPYSVDPRGRDRFPQSRPPDEGLALLHGHVHGRWRKRGREIDVGIDAWGGQLASEDDIASLLAGDGDTPPITWRG